MRNFGECDTDHAVIRIKRGLRGELLRHTFMHELLHAVFNAQGWASANKNEARIDALAGLIVQALESAE